MPITDEQKAATKVANPTAELHLVSHPDGAEIIVRPPTEPEWRIFRSLQERAETKPDAAPMLTNTCTVFPAKDDLKAMLAKHPAYVEVFAGEIAEVAGYQRGAAHTKL